MNSKYQENTWALWAWRCVSQFLSLEILAKSSDIYGALRNDFCGGKDVIKNQVVMITDGFFGATIFPRNRIVLSNLRSDDQTKEAPVDQLVAK